jgi:hypothetical protein
MGQKINPIIFRLGISKTWNTEFYETKKSELPFYTFQCIEIQQYIDKFLKNHGLTLHSYKIHYNQSMLNLYISYFIPTTLKMDNQEEINKTLEKLKKKTEILKFSEGINLFTNKKYKINTIFYCTNKSFHALNYNDLFFIERKIKVLGRFRSEKENFKFDEIFNLMCNSVLNENSAYMIGNSIAETLKNLKKHNRFLKCIQKIFTILISSKFSKIKSIKIQVSGKINRSRRTRTKVITIGDLPIQTINTNFDYSQTTVTHNPNGSFGLKIWVLYN